MKNYPLKVSEIHDGAIPIIFKNAAKLRGKMTPTEKKRWEHLKTKPFGFKYRRQHPIARYILDFYCHKLRISIEIDGDYHLDKEQKEKDNKRTQYINDLGISEIRFTYKQVNDEYQQVLETINDTIIYSLPQSNH